MQRIYLICIRAQYALWALYICSFVILYVLGFVIDTLSFRWLLIPETEIIVGASVALSLAIVGMFFFLRTSSQRLDSQEVRLRGVFPSMVVLAATIAYLVQSCLNG